MKTYVYIDGFNLYYGRLRGKPELKWLDLCAFSQSVLGDKYNVAAVKYYTAPIKVLNHNYTSQARQNIYHRALRQHNPLLDMYYGGFQVSKKYAQLVNPADKGAEKVEIYKIEEKRSDVNLATHMLNDAWCNLYECAVLISNDSDLESPLKLIRKHHSDKKIGLIPPVADGGVASRALMRHTDFIRNMRHSHFKNNQMPDKIKGTNLHRPRDWHIDEA